MDFGIAGRWAVVCASSQGLGRGCAEALAAQGVNLVVNARDEARLAATAQELREAAPGIEVREVAGDVSQPDVRERLLGAAPAVDILVNNAGGPPTGDFREWDEAEWTDALGRNMLAPIELIKATADGMADRGFGRIVNITSSAVKAPIAALGLSNGARSGLTGFVAGIARQPQLAGRNVTINNLLPGRFDTARIAATLEPEAEASGRSLEEVRAEYAAGIPAGRFGTPEEFGAACAFLCSGQAGYITGQNLLIDGGAYPGTF
ncbi:SDR family oxidoreductase [Gulosibacter sp. 10]|uniref:SDR family oxidoreductase n=1 Tax=Gulosibacter sp. 10 TaxID=1255570 RepID=UPI00097EC921|nr:SDR family oxidoreductase [Gulosibacter sp. 10]SJM64472.1 3-oxoacyl-[acyl-carrier protein] reductase [Gulosibacter sp. 10]